MRTATLFAAAAAMLASSVAGFAADSVATGTIKALNMPSKTLTLSDGMVYTLPPNFKDPGLKVGESVKISWNLAGKVHQADTIVITK